MYDSDDDDDDNDDSDGGDDDNDNNREVCILQRLLDHRWSRASGIGPSAEVASSSFAPSPSFDLSLSEE
jgi:hypothetical protein